MISTKKLLTLARKWQKLASLSRKRLIFPTTKDGSYSNSCSSTSSRVEKGHFVVYSADQRRFVIPLVYLQNNIFVELLKLAEEEYGLPTDGPITLPCDSVFMEYAVSLVQRHSTKDIEVALLVSIANSSHCLSSSCNHQEETSRNILIHGF